MQMRSTGVETCNMRKWNDTDCLYRPGDVYRVVLGEHDISLEEGTEQVRDILRIVVHPNWDIDHVGNGWVYSEKATPA